MARRVDQVELVGLAVVGRIIHAHGLALDGDASLALDIHAVEQLLLHVALRHRAGQFQHAVGQRRLSMVDVRDDREVSYEVRVGGHSLSFKTSARTRALEKRKTILPHSPRVERARPLQFHDSGVRTRRADVHQLRADGTVMVRAERP